MNIIDTRDLIEKRDELKEEILNDWNEKFEDNQIDDFDEIPLNSEDEAEKDFINYWRAEIEEIEEIDNLEDEIGSEFDFGVFLIDEDDFEEYCEDLVSDIGDLPRDIPSYLYNNIDWSGVADDIKQDYSEVEYQGITYLYR